MVKEYWKKFMRRNKRVLAEVAEIQMGLAREYPKPLMPNIFPNRSNSISTVIIFWAVAVLVATTC